MEFVLVFYCGRLNDPYDSNVRLTRSKMMIDWFPYREDSVGRDDVRPTKRDGCTISHDGGLCSSLRPWMFRFNSRCSSYDIKSLPLTFFGGILSRGIHNKDVTHWKSIESVIVSSQGVFK